MIGIPRFALAAAACLAAGAIRPGAARGDDTAHPIATAVVRFDSGALAITAGLYRPTTPGTFPGLVIGHAEMRGHVAAEWWALRFAQLGYCVLVPDFRGQGQSEGKIEIAAGEVDDLLASIRFLREQSGVDASAIALLGDGHGAAVCLLALSRGAEARACAVLSPPADLAALVRDGGGGSGAFAEFLAAKIGGSPDALPDEWARRSPLSVASQIRRPVLFLHGGRNETVPPSESLALYRAVLASGVPAERKVFPDVGAAFEGASAWEAFLIARSFLDRHVRRDRRPRVRFRTVQARVGEGKRSGTADVQVQWSASALSPIQGWNVYVRGVPSDTSTRTLVYTPSATATARHWLRDLTATRTPTVSPTVTPTFPVPADYLRWNGSPLRRRQVEMQALPSGGAYTILVTGMARPPAVSPTPQGSATALPPVRLPTEAVDVPILAAASPSVQPTPEDEFLEPLTLVPERFFESAPAPPVEVRP